MEYVTDKTFPPFEIVIGILAIYKYLATSKLLLWNTAD